MTLERTIQAFGRELKRLELEGSISFTHCDFASGNKNGVSHQVRRVRNILNFLKEGSPEKLRELTRCRVKYGDLSSTALTWAFNVDWVFDMADNVPYYMRHANLFHNEGIMDHFGAYLLGSQGTSVLSRLFHEQNWDEINTDYFKNLQSRARGVLEQAKAVQIEILGSDKIFKVKGGVGNLLYVPHPTWELSAEETLRMVDRFRLALRNSYMVDWSKLFVVRAYIDEGIIPDEAHRFRNPQRVVRFHDLIDDPRIQQPFPDYDIDRDIYDNPTFKGIYNLEEVQETAYLVKESERMDEMQILGAEMIDIFQSVGKVLRGVVERYGN